MKMKILFMTLVLALVLMSGSALRCFHCPLDGDSRCSPKIKQCNLEECSIVKNTYFTIGTSFGFKECIAVCFALRARVDYKDLRCCKIPSCN